MEDSYVILNQLFYPDKISFQMRESHCKLPQNTHFFKEHTSESATFQLFLLGLLSLNRGPAFRPKACLPARLEAHRDHSGGLRKGFCGSFSYLGIFNKALSTHTQSVSVRQEQPKPNSVKLLHSICKSYNANGSLLCIKVILPSF